jgi:hypothetical protein
MAKLFAFRNLAVEYYENCTFGDFQAIPNEQAAKLRPEINREMDEIHDIVMAAGVDPRFYYDPPPIRRRPVGQVDAILNLFNLPHLQLDVTTTTDELERAYGVYERNKKPAMIRLFNPFFYLGRLFEFIAEIPFIILGKIGFDRGKAEVSRAGRIIRGFIEITGWIAVVLPALELLGWWKHIKSFFSHR